MTSISAIFASSKATESIHMHTAKARSEFESAVLRDPSKILAPGGTVHQLTCYVMNYTVNLIPDYKASRRSELIITSSGPSSHCSSRIEDDDEATPPAFPDSDDSRLPSFAAHLSLIIVALEHNLEISKAPLYKDVALSHLFLMNNMHYIVHKIRDSSELRGLIGGLHLKRLTSKFQQAAVRYQRFGWLKILNYTRPEGLRASSGFSTGISKLVLLERFKGFSAGFWEAHKVQSGWYVQDTRLREELRISISEKLCLAYRPFLGGFRHHIENGKSPEYYIRYSVEDLEEAMADFFEGASPATHN